jgi:hypothetical protein
VDFISKDHCTLTFPVPGGDGIGLFLVIQCMLVVHHFLLNVGWLIRDFLATLIGVHL